MKTWGFGNLYDNAMTILNHLKHSGRIVVYCGRDLNRSSTVAESGLFVVALDVLALGESGYH